MPDTVTLACETIAQVGERVRMSEEFVIGDEAEAEGEIVEIVSADEVMVEWSDMRGDLHKHGVAELVQADV